MSQGNKLQNLTAHDFFQCYLIAFYFSCSYNPSFNTTTVTETTFGVADESNPTLYC